MEAERLWIAETRDNIKTKKGHVDILDKYELAGKQEGVAARGGKEHPSFCPLGRGAEEHSLTKTTTTKSKQNKAQEAGKGRILGQVAGAVHGKPGQELFSTLMQVHSQEPSQRTGCYVKDRQNTCI